MLTKRKFSLSKQLFFLCNGATTAFFASSGCCDFLIVKFIILVIGFKTVDWADLRILAELPSHPVAFLRFSLLICLLINSSLICLNSNDEASVRLSLIFKILGWFSFTGKAFWPIFLATFTKKWLKMPQTYCWSLISLLSSNKIVSLCTCVPLFVKTGFTVGQKSFDLQRPTHLSIKYLLIDSFWVL